MSAEEKRITLKLVVDTEKKKVVFAEAGKDFVDVLFSFLTLPLGTIIKLVGKQPTLGSLCNLYESIENLDVEHLQTEACKTMLLHPQSAAALRCEDLKLNVDATKPRKVFHCSKPDCCAKSICLGSSIANARCPHCRQIMNSDKSWHKRDADSVCEADGHGVFIKGGATFMISDDLQVNPVSLTHSLSLFKKMGIEDAAVLEEKKIDLGTEDFINLLQRSLLSNAPLTEIFINDTRITNDAPDGIGLPDLIQIKTEGGIENIESEKTLTVKLLVAGNKVLFAEAGEDFADTVLSFLALPLGSVIKLLSTNSCMGCVDNLYGSVQTLSTDYIKSDECRDMLLSPKLTSFFGCENSLLKMDEIPPREDSVVGRCFTCQWDGIKDAKCKHGVDKSRFTMLNPKSPSGDTEIGGGYAKGPGKYMVTDDLHMYSLSAVSISQVIRSQDSPVSKLVEAEAKIDQARVLNLLKAALISKTPLSSVFSPSRKQKQRKRMHIVA